MIDIYRGQLWLSTKNEEVEDTTGLCSRECADSDGDDIYTFGRVTGKNETGMYEYLDSCPDPKHVQEWTCNENNLPADETIACRLGTYCLNGRCVEYDGMDYPEISCSENDLILLGGTWDDGLIGFKYWPGTVLCNPADDCPEGSKCNFDACICLPPGGWDEVLKGGKLSEPLPTTTAPTPTSESPTATPEPEDESISVGQLFGGHECAAQCKQIGMVYIKTNRSIPAANATVTIRMTGPDGTDQVTTAISGPDGVAEFSFPAPSHDDYTLTVENVEAGDLVYDPAQNQLSSVVVGSIPQPLPERAALPVTDFLKPFVAAMQSGNTSFLLEHLHPAVIEIYGSEQCRSYLEGVSDPLFDIELLSASGPSAWEWKIDGISTFIPDAYTVNINRTSGGTTSIGESHFAFDDQNRLGWFTDCGDPQ
jgi:hypothetical protein